jgi:hypothetical protein
MSKTRLLSGRVKKVSGGQLNASRHKFLDLSNAEPDLGFPDATGSVLISTNTGTRAWSQTLTNITLTSATVTNNLYVNGDVYSNGGSPLYTPRITISTLAPIGARVGDFWIDTDNGVEFQYVKDGDNFYWIQFTGI